MSPFEDYFQEKKWKELNEEWTFEGTDEVGPSVVENSNSRSCPDGSDGEPSANPHRKSSDGGSEKRLMDIIKKVIGHKGK